MRTKPEPCLCLNEESGGVLLCIPSTFEDADLCPKIILNNPETRPNSYGATQRGEVLKIKTSSIINAKLTGCCKFMPRFFFTPRFQYFKFCKVAILRNSRYENDWGRIGAWSLLPFPLLTRHVDVKLHLL